MRDLSIVLSRLGKAFVIPALRCRRPGDGGRDRIDLDKMKKKKETEWKNNGSAGLGWPRASHIANESKWR